MTLVNNNDYISIILVDNWKFVVHNAITSSYLMWSLLLLSRVQCVVLW